MSTRKKNSRNKKMATSKKKPNYENFEFMIESLVQPLFPIRDDCNYQILINRQDHHSVSIEIAINVPLQKNPPEALNPVISGNTVPVHTQLGDGCFDRKEVEALVRALCGSGKVQPPENGAIVVKIVKQSITRIEIHTKLKRPA